MLKSSLLEILTFTKQELVKFEDFIRSPFHNKKENAVKLFLNIKTFPNFDDESLGKDKVWQGIFPETVYNYGIMKNLIFDLNKLAEQFIVILKFNKDEYKQNEYLVNGLLDRELHKIYNIKHNAIDKDPDINYLSESNIEIDDYLNFKYKIYDIKLLHHQKFDLNFKIENLQLKHDSYKLSSFLLQLFSTYGNTIVSRMNNNIDPANNPIYKFLELINPNLDIIMESIKKDSKFIHQYTEIYLSAMFIALREKTEKSYFELKNIVFKNLNILPKSTMQSLHYSIYLALNLNQGKLNKYKETVEIFDSDRK